MANKLTHYDSNVAVRSPGLADTGGYDRAARYIGQSVNALNQIHNEAFAIAKDKRLEEASRDAQAWDVQRDPETGDIVPPEYPNPGPLGATIYEKAYESAVSKRYLFALEDEGSRAAAAIAKDHLNDPVGFDEAWKAYMDGVVNEVPGQVRGAANDTLSRMGSSYYTRMVSTKASNDFKAAASTWETAVQKSADDLTSMVYAGSDPSTVLDAYQQYREKLIGGMQFVAGDPATQAAQLANMETSLEKRLVQADVERDLFVGSNGKPKMLDEGGIAAAMVNVEKVKNGTLKVPYRDLQEDGTIQIKEVKIGDVLTTSELKTYSSQLKQRAIAANSLYKYQQASVLDGAHKELSQILMPYVMNPGTIDDPEAVAALAIKSISSKYVLQPDDKLNLQRSAISILTGRYNTEQADNIAGALTNIQDTENVRKAIETLFGAPGEEALKTMDGIKDPSTKHSMLTRLIALTGAASSKSKTNNSMLDLANWLSNSSKIEQATGVKQFYTGKPLTSKQLTGVETGLGIGFGEFATADIEKKMQLVGLGIKLQKFTPQVKQYILHTLQNAADVPDGQLAEVQKIAKTIFAQTGGRSAAVNTFTPQEMNGLRQLAANGNTVYSTNFKQTLQDQVISNKLPSTGKFWNPAKARERISSLSVDEHWPPSMRASVIGMVGNFSQLDNVDDAVDSAVNEVKKTEGWYKSQYSYTTNPDGWTRNGFESVLNNDSDAIYAGARQFLKFANEHNISGRFGDDIKLDLINNSDKQATFHIVQRGADGHYKTLRAGGTGGQLIFVLDKDKIIQSGAESGSTISNILDSLLPNEDYYGD